MSKRPDTFVTLASGPRARLVAFATSLSLMLVIAAGPACDDSGDSASEADISASGDISMVSACVGSIVLGRYRTADCVAGEEVGSVTIDLALPCSAWTRQSRDGTKSDSFTRLQCYRDRICFTVHPGSATCADGDEDGDVELMAGACQQDKPLADGTLLPNYTKIISSLDGCPDAPVDVACPVSDVGGGTSGIVAASCGE